MPAPIGTVAPSVPAWPGQTDVRRGTTAWGVMGWRDARAIGRPIQRARRAGRYPDVEGAAPGPSTSPLPSLRWRIT